MTDAELQANDLSMQNMQEQWQRNVTGMQQAGLNPALMYGSSPSGSAPTASTDTGSGSLSDLMQLISLRKEMKVLDSQAEKNKLEGEAAMTSARAAATNAGANERNAATNERNAATNEYNALTGQFNSTTQRMNAETERMKLDILSREADSRIRVNENEADRIAGQLAYLKIQAEMLPKQVEIAEGNMKASQKQAAAAYVNAQAAARNAAINEKQSDSVIALRNAQAAFEWANKEGKDIVNKYLDERQQKELANLEKEGIKLDAQGRLVDKQGRLVDSQMVKTYVNCATDVSHAFAEWFSPFSKGNGSSASPGFDLSGAYQGVAYGYD